MLWTAPWTAPVSILQQAGSFSKMFHNLVRLTNNSVIYNRRYQLFIDKNKSFIDY